MENDVNKTIDDAVIKLLDNARVSVDPVKADAFASAAKKAAETKAILQGCKQAGSSESKKN